MVKFLRIKEKARGLARQQKYDQALAEYRAAIGQAEADGDLPALRNLYNAAGDAALQKPDSAVAIEWFEKAADSYLDEGLFDNAIALCHKILRHVPTKADVYAKLGRIYAEKGLRAEAARNWLEYADRREKAGDARAVTLALREALAAVPDDAAIRERLTAHLERAGAAGVVEGEPPAATVGPAFGAPPPAPARTPPGAGGTVPSVPAAASAPSSPPAPITGEAYVPVAPSAGESPARTPAGTGAAGGGLGFATGGPALAPPGAPAPPPPPDAGTAPRPDSETARPPIWTLPGFTAPDAPPLAEGAAAAVAPDRGVRPSDALPRIPSVPVEERLERAEARVAENPADAEERVYLGELYLEIGDDVRAVASMTQGARELAAAGEAEKAWRAWRQVVALTPGDPAPAERLLEAAAAADKDDLVAESLQILAERLVASGRYDQAAEVYRRILRSRPDDGPARDGLLLLEGLIAAPSAAPAVPSGAPTPPAGAEHAAAGEDLQSHFDLGVAFRDMGLVDEAVREFQLAARGEVLRGRALEMIGRCHLERGHAELAVNCFRRGLEAETIPEHVRSLRYYLARALQDSGEAPAARLEYERVVAEDASFLDAAERLRGLA
ncbi:MAG TPA: tetratricopeptide repeat protein [Gemmatimonadota bacterium]|jgi:tetratricopeptide (TPR) repeat protein